MEWKGVDAHSVSAFSLTTGTGLGTGKILIEKARRYAVNSRSGATKRAYCSDWRDFQAWCERHRVDSLPAPIAVVIGYLTDNADRYAVSTLSRRLTSISQAHKAAGYASPASTAKEPLHSVWAGIVREKGRAQAKKGPLLIEEIREIVNALPDRLIGVRDRAVILLGFAGAFRRSELVGLNVEDLEFVREGLKVNLRGSKTDQEQDGRAVGIPYGEHPETCPVMSTHAWVRDADLMDGPLFRSVDRHGNIG